VESNFSWLECYTVFVVKKFFNRVNFIKFNQINNSFENEAGDLWQIISQFCESKGLGIKIEILIIQFSTHFFNQSYFVHLITK
jgi:hypothetical protein